MSPQNVAEHLDSDNKKRLIESHMTLVHAAYNSDCKILRKDVSDKMAYFWSSIFSTSRYSELLATVDEESIRLLALWSCLLHSSHTPKEVIEKHKTRLLQMLATQVIGSKADLNQNMVRSGFKDIVIHISHEDFCKTFLPLINRSILRNPEVSLKIVASLLCDFPLDLSQHSLELGKLFATNLHSKEDNLREWAIIASENLAQQCSEFSAVENLVKHYFDVLNGAEGKLVVVTQKMGVISGIGVLSRHSVPGAGSGNDLSLSVCQNFISFLKNEVHEATLLHAIQELRRWCRKFSGKFPAPLVEWQKSSRNLKVTTVTMRCAYISCLNEAVNESTVESGSGCIPLLAEVVSKNLTVPAAQALIISEGLEAALFILKCGHLQPIVWSKCKTVLDILLSPNKLSFLSVKFISTAPEDSLATLISVLVLLIQDFQDKLQHNMKALQTTIITLALNPSLKIRKEANSACIKILRQAMSSEYQIQMNQSFLEVISTYSLDERVNINGDESNKEQKVPESAPFKTLMTINLCECPESNKWKLLMSAFLPSHLPPVYNHRPKTWLLLIEKLLKSEERQMFLKEKMDELMALLENQGRNLRWNCLVTLSQILPQQLIPALVKTLVQLLENEDLNTISRKDYEIYGTPPGILYDAQVLDMFREEEDKNIKRESKLYSYKEQIEEIKLRKELEAKNPKKEVVLNKKQLEAKEKQLRIEGEIRSRISVLNSTFERAISDLEALMSGNPYVVVREAHMIFPPLVKLFSSPLCAPLSSKLFLLLGNTIFSFYEPKDIRFLADSVGYATLRKRKVACPISKSWANEPLDSLENRIVRLIHSRTSRPKGENYDEKLSAQAIENRLTACSFSYFFPLLKDIMLTPDRNEDVLLKCLELTAEHLKMRLDPSAPNGTRGYLKNPEYLPRAGLMSIMLQLMTSCPDHILDEVTLVILQIAKASSGEPGTAPVSHDELSIVLDALKSDKEALRKVALNCLLIWNKCLKSLPLDMNEIDLKAQKRIYVARFDSSEKVAELALELWEACQFNERHNLAQEILQDLEDAGAEVKRSSAAAMKILLQSFPQESEPIFQNLMQLYREHNKKPPIIIDAFGRPTGETHPDRVGPRESVALCLKQLMEEASPTTIPSLISFFVPEALGDRNTELQNLMLEASIHFVDVHGKENVTILLNALQKFMEEAPDSSANDSIRKSIIILMGNLGEFNISLISSTDVGHCQRVTWRTMTRV